MRIEIAKYHFPLFGQSTKIKFHYERSIRYNRIDDNSGHFVGPFRLCHNIMVRLFKLSIKISLLK